MNWAAFFTLHSDLPREGPGLPEDVAWAAECASLAPDARMLDAGCGPGADIAALLTAAPGGSVLAVDTHAPFADAAANLHDGDPRVRALAMDMGQVDGPFDLIWSAGALYFLGIAEGLPRMAEKLAPGGAIAFSHLIYTTPDPDPAVRAVLEAEPDIMGLAPLQTLIGDLGFAILGTRILPDAAWAAYYDPMRARMAELEADADADLRAVLAESQAEIDLRETFGDQYGYALHVVRPA